MKESSIPTDKEIWFRAKKDGVSKLAVGAGIKRDGKVLVVKRASIDFLPQIWELPGGGLEEGESLEETLRREIREEVGLEIIKIFGLFKGFDYQSEDGFKTRQVNFAVSVYKGRVVLNNSEHVEFAWIISKDIITKPDFRFTAEILSSLRDLFSRL